MYGAYQPPILLKSNLRVLVKKVVSATLLVMHNTTYIEQLNYLVHGDKKLLLRKAFG